VLQWNQIAVETIGAQPPFPSARFMAVVQLAVFEAVNAISKEYEPYLGTVTAPPGASPEAAVITAAHGVLEAFFPAAAASLAQQRADSLAAIEEGGAKVDGIAVGEAAAAALIADRVDDGAAPAEFFLPTNSAPYEWQTTPSCSASGGIFLHWRNVKPFGIESSAQFRAAPPPALTSAEYAAAYNEVRAVGGVDSLERPQDRADVAQLYAGQGAHQAWNSIARQLARARPDRISRTARTFALLNMAISDAVVSVFESKYFYAAWRPETAIPRGDEDDNAQTVASPFTPFVVTPCFPSYPSGHGSAAGAGSQVLRSAYGEAGHSLTNSAPSAPGVVLHYTDLEEIVRDISDARVFGGIHFRFDQDAAEKLGTEVANYDIQNSLRRVRCHWHDDQTGDD
jgi:hypothetical protein